MAARPTFPAAELESVCRVLADTDNGLSDSETEQDALDLLTMASFCHRRLDSAARTPRTA